MRPDWIQEQADSYHSHNPFSLAYLASWDLLATHLNKRQLYDCDRYRTFDVAGSEGGKYRISLRQYQENVYQYGHEMGFVRWCAFVQSVAHFDNHLGQKLLIETDEGAWLRVAIGSNISYSEIDDHGLDKRPWHGREYKVHSPLKERVQAMVLARRLER